nr:hypothetical protein [Tanacetum cinerariifolium]
MLGSIDCMHWEWTKCPKALHGQFKRRDKNYPTIMLEAVADQQLWFWHAYFGVRGANNDLNVLYGPPLFDDLLTDKAPEVPFVVNGKTYEKCYYLADGIYPQWSTFVKAFTIARDQNTMRFKRVQESAKKDIERAFGVLQAWTDRVLSAFQDEGPFGQCRCRRQDDSVYKDCVAHAFIASASSFLGVRIALSFRYASSFCLSIKLGYVSAPIYAIVLPAGSSKDAIPRGKGIK